MKRQSPQSDKRTTIINNLFVAGFYVVLAKWGLTFATVNESTTAIWPPTGFAIAMVIIFGARIWPAIFAGALLANLTTTGNMLTSVGIALGNTLEAVVAAFLISRFAGGVNTFTLPSWVFRFAVAAGLIGPAISAAIGVTTLWLGRLITTADIPVVWTTWALGNMGGALLFTPLILLWYKDHSLTLLGRHPVKVILAMAVICAASYLAFSGVFPYAYIVMPVLLFVSFVFTPRETATGVLVVAIIATYATLARSGPFWSTTLNETRTLLVLQVFLGILSVTKLAIAVSIAKEREQESLVHETDRWYKTLIEKSSDAISLIDADATILYASPSTEQVLGYPPREFVGVRGLSLIHPDDLPRIVKTLARVVATPNTPIRDEFRYRHKDGRWIWLQTTGRNLLSDPAIHAIVINYHDITESKDLEQAKDDFMMIAAHQLRTPISSVRWNAELLLKSKTKLPGPVTRGVQAILDSTHQMVRLIDELLEMSRIIAGANTTKVHPLDVATAIQNEIATLVPLSAERQVKVVFRKPDPPLPRLNVDETRFLRVVQNVLSNAIKYSNPKSSVTVTCGMEDDRLVITVTDSGIGIPRDEQYKLYTKFFRADNARKRDPNGKGLGLYAVKSYMDSWGGHIAIVSPTLEGSRGTTVELSFPALLTSTIKKGGKS